MVSLLRALFVIDSGFGCNEQKPLDDYLGDEMMEATGACVDGEVSYLVHPDGDARKLKCARPNQY